MSSEPSAAGPSSEQAASGTFECNICFESPTKPVLSRCGHVFCWPCIYRWLHTANAERVCPVCKAGVTEENLIPIYGKDGEADPRQSPPEDVPERPRGQPEAAPPPGHNRGGGHAPFGLQFGSFGLMGPFFGFTFGTGGLGGGPFGFTQQPTAPHQPLTPEQERNERISRVLFTAGCIVLLLVLTS